MLKRAVAMQMKNCIGIVYMGVKASDIHLSSLL